MALPKIQTDLLGRFFVQFYSLARWFYRGTIWIYSRQGFYMNVSVILPCYNVEKYIERCLNSLVQQTMGDIEIICVDDKSTDKTRDIIQQFANADKRIRAIFLDSNHGPGYARNIGMHNANGEYVSFIDPDDYIDTNFYAVLFDLAQSQNLDVAKGGFFLTDIANGTEHVSKQNKSIDTNQVLFSGEHHSAIYRREFLIKNAIEYPTDVVTGEDSVFLSRLATKNKKIATTDTVFYHYMFNRPGSLDSANFSHAKVMAIISVLNYKVAMLPTINYDSGFIEQHILLNFIYIFNKNMEQADDKKLLFDWLVKHRKLFPNDMLMRHYGNRRARAIQHGNFKRFVSPKRRFLFLFKI